MGPGADIGGTAAGRPVWVLLRGLSRSAAHWGDFPARVEAAGLGRAICIDLPGNGEAAALASPIDIAAMLTHVRARLVDLRITVPVHVLALSMGGMVACEWARRHPAELVSVVLVNSSLRGISRLTQRLQPSAWPSLLRLVAWPASDESWERTIHRLTSSHVERRDGVVAEWVALRRAQPVGRINVLRQLLAAARYAAPRDPPDVALLVLVGLRDALVDPRCSIDLARRWGARLMPHPSAGHDLPLDDPAWVIEALRAWQRDAGAPGLPRMPGSAGGRTCA